MCRFNNSTKQDTGEDNDANFGPLLICPEQKQRICSPIANHNLRWMERKAYKKNSIALRDPHKVTSRSPRGRLPEGRVMTCAVDES